MRRNSSVVNTSMTTEGGSLDSATAYAPSSFPHGDSGTLPAQLSGRCALRLLPTKTASFSVFLSARRHCSRFTRICIGPNVASVWALRFWSRPRPRLNLYAEHSSKIIFFLQTMRWSRWLPLKLSRHQALRSVHVTLGPGSAFLGHCDACVAVP